MLGHDALRKSIEQEIAEKFVWGLYAKMLEEHKIEEGMEGQ